MISAVLFGFGIVLVLTIERLAQHSWVLIPLVVVASLIFAWPISWLIVPRLRKPLWRRRQLAAEGKPVGTPEEREALASKAGAGPDPSRRERR
jgi:peptidoglycan/LPS O-acetylase OafA/YrhL